MTDAAERASAGCADAVRTSLSEARDLIIKSHSVEDALERMNMCPNTLPEYIVKKHTLSDEVMSAVGFTFADFDSGYYPPGPDMGLRKACDVFQDPSIQACLE